MRNNLVMKGLYNGVDFDISFDNNVNFLCGNSGTGKTFLMHALELFCSNSDITCQYVDYRSRKKSLSYIMSLCSDAEVILLDNADLYLTQEILTALKSQGKFLVISMKDTCELDTYDSAQYVVKYKHTNLRLKRI